MSEFRGTPSGRRRNRLSDADAVSLVSEPPASDAVSDVVSDISKFDIGPPVRTLGIPRGSSRHSCRGNPVSNNPPKSMDDIPTIPGMRRSSSSSSRSSFCKLKDEPDPMSNEESERLFDRRGGPSTPLHSCRTERPSTPRPPSEHRPQTPSDRKLKSPSGRSSSKRVPIPSSASAFTPVSPERAVSKPIPRFWDAWRLVGNYVYEIPRDDPIYDYYRYLYTGTDVPRDLQPGSYVDVPAYIHHRKMLAASKKALSAPEKAARASVVLSTVDSRGNPKSSRVSGNSVEIIQITAGCELKIRVT